MGMTVSVLRNPLYRGCSMGGASEKHWNLTVVNVEGPFEPRDDAPAYRLDSHVPGIVRLVPEGEKRWVSASGTFAQTCDSRFSEAVEKLTGQRFYGAVAIHDRVES